MKKTLIQIKTTVIFFLLLTGLLEATGQNNDKFDLPLRGFCAHRGALETHPENTIPAFEAAIQAGAHMIEFDVQLTKDKHLVLMHDATINRTTNGTGKVENYTLKELKKLDAGSWKSPEYAGIKIPTFLEALEVMPQNIWINVHIKGDAEIAVLATKVLMEQKRLHQAFLAVGAKSATAAKRITPDIMICNMDRRKTIQQYVEETIAGDFDFIQIPGEITSDLIQYSKSLKAKGIRINYVRTDSPEDIKQLFDYGIEFILCDDIVNTIETAEINEIQPLDPVYIN
ncbi:glycerophosphodiester phosphodiesterase [Flexithrix dorotheae]|uniref:glycerophosphodiester phosphodiesterase n=1 Tax=Flexithrix dorotheae TaxID=70993 RepID=UPI000374D7F8|nr:glycerophosphodiester phosphodiesterase family protein [Flexithrix dorotheae]